MTNHDPNNKLCTCDGCLWESSCEDCGGQGAGEASGARVPDASPDTPQYPHKAIWTFATKLDTLAYHATPGLVARLLAPAPPVAPVPAGPACPYCGGGGSVVVPHRWGVGVLTPVDCDCNGRGGELPDSESKRLSDIKALLLEGPK